MKYNSLVNMGFKGAFKWICLAFMVGVCGGIGGSLLHIVVDRFTVFRVENKEVLFLLPLIGVFLVYFYKKTRFPSHLGLSGVFTYLRNGEKIPLRLLPIIFTSNVLIHLCGGSTGREGAALQIGGSIGAGFSRIPAFSKMSSPIIVLNGMSAALSALFGTPLAAMFFCIEVVHLKKIKAPSILPCCIASFTGYYISLLLGITPLSYELSTVPKHFEVGYIIPIIIISVFAVAVKNLFRACITVISKIYGKYFKNDYIRIVVGSLTIIAMTMMVGNFDYNGSGMDLVNRAIAGEDILLTAILLKIIFTAITMAAGFRGGEVLPTLCIGAVLGASIAPFIGINSSLAAAMGLVIFFAATLNCPLASIFLGIEIFGIESAMYIVIGCAVISLFTYKTLVKTVYKTILEKFKKIINFRKKDKKKVK